MQAIDIHAHYLPPLLIEKIKKNQALFPYVKLEDTQDGSVRFKVGSENWTRPVSPSLMNLEQRLPEMDKQAISLQINAGWMDIFGYSLNSEQGREWSLFLNETLAEAIAIEKIGHRFAPMATVPLQNGEAAAEILKKAVAAGHYGVMIGTWIPGGEAHEEKDLDDPSLEPFWEAAEKLAAPVFIHPVFAGANSRAAKWGMVNAVARPNETGISIARILYSGILERYPNLKLIIAHGGGSLPMILGRLQRNFETLKTKETISDPVAGFKKLYFDSVVFEPETLQYLLQLAGLSRILLGSDAPFPIRDPFPRLVVDSKRLNLNEDERNRILFGNAQELFQLKHVVK